MRKMYQLLSFLCCFFITMQGYSQISYTENFDGGLGTWASSGAAAFFSTTTTPCTGTGSVRANVYDFATTAVLRSPVITSSNGGVATVSFDYKIIDWSGGAATPNPWGSFTVEYSTSSSGPWTPVYTVNAASHTPAATCATKTFNFSPPTGDIYLRFNASWTAGDYYLYFDEINITQGAAPACVMPANLSSNTVTTTSANVTWDASPSASVSGYQWEVRTSGAAGSGATGLLANGSTTTALTAALTTLTANTSYSLYVRSDCAGTFSAWAGPYNFTTPCTTATLPYLEDFESAAVPAMPSCTSIENAGTGNDWITSSTVSNGFNTKHLRYSYNSANAANAWFYLQPVSLTAGTSYRLNFKYGNNSTTYIEKLEVKYGTAATSASMTDLIVDHPSISIAAQANSSTDFIPSATGTYYIGFHVYSAADQFNLFVDDIMVMVTPTCEEPTALVFSSITNNSVQLEWTAPAVTSPVDYQIYHSTSNVAPNSGTTPTVLNASSPATISSLSPGTKYYVWVRSNCGAGAGVSIWTIRDSVITECLPVTTLNENFDGVTTPNLPACWGKLLRGTAGTPNVTTSTASANTTPNAVLLANSSSTTSADIMLVSPPLSNIGAGTHRLKFWARNATATEDLEIGTLDNKSSTATFSLLQSIDINGTYAEYVVDFTGYAGTDQYIAIKRLSTATFSSVYIDNFVWEAIPVCDAPTLPVITTFTTTTAEVNWTAPTVGSPVNYQIYYSTTNTAPTGASTPNVTGATAPATITGLTPNTLYYVWIRTNCGAGGVSNWSVMTSFTTACNATNLPYSENFETATVPNMPQCTIRENAGTGNNWVTANNPGSGFTSKTLRYTYNTTNAANAWFYTQGLNLVGGTSYRITYRYGTNSTTTYFEKLEIKYGSNPSSASMSDMIVDYPSLIGTTPQNGVNDFTPATTGVYYIGFHVYSAADQNSLFVDDISVYVTPTCNEPTGILVSNPSTTGATVEWTPPTVSSPLNYQIYYSTSNTAPTSGSTPNLSNQTSPATLTGLTANTTYYLWVRSNCGGADLSLWGGPVMFTTPCDATTVPYSQNFESAAVPNLPSCTSRENVGTGNDWTTAAAPGNGFTSKTLQYAYSTANPADAWFYTQGLTLTGGVSYKISYRYGNNNAGWTEKLEVKYGTAPSSSNMNDLIADHPSINNAAANSAAFDFTPATTGVYYIGFHAYSIANQWNLYVDDISVIVSPTCNEPTAVAVSNPTTTGAQVDWTPPAVGTPASYQIYYSTANTVPTAGSTPNVTGIIGNTTNLTGLNPGTTYYLWVRSFCGGTDNSIWTPTAQVFTTLCIANTNFAQNFDGVTAPALPACWSKVGSTGLAYTQTGSNNSAPNTMYIYSGSATDLAVVSLPPVSNLSSGVNTLRFKARGNFTAGGVIEVGYLATPGDATSFVMVNPVTISTLTYQDYIVTIPTLPSGTQVLALRHTGVPALSVLIDNVEYNAALPVTLVDFRGEKAGSANKLIWTTSTEINNKGFEMERSADGRNFTALTFVTSKAESGNSNATLNYSYNDVRPLSGSNYYRLKQIDRDGKTTYSDIVVLKSKVSDITLSSVYPNPATRELKMIITSPSAEKVTIVVTDLTGKVIMQQTAQLVIGDNQSQMNVQQLAAGTYLVKAICANGCETAVQRFVKY